MTQSLLLPAKRLIEPDVWTCPHGKRTRPEVFETFGPEVADLLSNTELPPDPQQELILDLVFAFRRDGSPASFEICIICCRQNMKTGSLKQIAVGWLYVSDEPEIMWSAHEMSTTLDAQTELADLIRASPVLRKRMLPQKNEGVYSDNGSERIELMTPDGRRQTVGFKARTKTGARGLARKKLILDEAFALTPRQQGSLIPVMLAKQDPQVVYASSPGMHGADALGEIRSRGTAGTTPMMTYVEWNSPRTECEDPDCQHPKNGDQACALNRTELWVKANPAVSTGRITIEKLANTRQALPADEWMRECLGWWDEDDEADVAAAINMRMWGALGDKTLPAPTRAAVVLDVEPDQSAGTVAVAGRTEDGRTLILVHTKPGIAWMVSRVESLRSNLDVLEVALHPGSQAATLNTRLIAAGIDTHPLTSHDQAEGCGSFIAGIDETTYAHLHQPELTGQAAVARTRLVNGRQVWDRRDPRIPIGSVAAASYAAQRWAVLIAKPDTPPPSPRRVTPVHVAAGSIATVGF